MDLTQLIATLTPPSLLPPSSLTPFLLLPPSPLSLPLSLPFPPQAFGGSGSYHWSLREKNGVIAVNSGGVVTALMEGSSSVQATDQKNPLHFASAKVWCAM